MTQRAEIPKVPLQISCSSGQLQGARRRQEDAVALRIGATGCIGIVADGLGGHSRGDEASLVAVTSMTNDLSRYLLGGHFDPDLALYDAVYRAHLAVAALGNKEHDVRSPATTVVGGLFRADQAAAHLANVGDSLAFLLRNGVLERIFVPQGRGNLVDFALGFDLGPANAAIVRRTLFLSPGDRILLASDGIQSVDADGIRKALRLPNARACCERLLSWVIAAQHRHQDNCTVLAAFLDQQS